MNTATVLKVQASENVLVALTDLKKGSKVIYQDKEIVLVEDIAAKHKIAFQDLLLFAPQLAQDNPFKSNPNAILLLNTELSGKLDNLEIPFFEISFFIPLDN